jgi:hypothetical protein
VRQGFPENELSFGLPVWAFAAFAVGIVRTGRAATHIGEEYQTDANHQAQNEQPYVLISGHNNQWMGVHLLDEVIIYLLQPDKKLPMGPNR